jgi:hypothetical protein
LAGFFSQETKPFSEVKPVFTTEKCKPPYRNARDENDPTGVSGVCGLRPARGWSFLFPWPARCGLGRLVENGPALADNSGHREALGPLTGVSFVDSCFFDRTERDWQQWMETGLDALTGAVVALRKKGKEEPPRDPKDAARLTPKSSPHGADDTSPRCTRQTRSNAEMAANDT